MPCYVSERTNVWLFLVPRSPFNSYRPSAHIAENRFIEPSKAFCRLAGKGCARVPGKRYSINAKEISVPCEINIEKINEASAAVRSNIAIRLAYYGLGGFGVRAKRRG